MRPLWLAATAISCAVAPTSAQAQREPALRPDVFVGPSLFMFDAMEEPIGATGGAVRIGFRAPSYELGLVLEHWADVADFRITTVLLEATYPLGQRDRFTPHLVAGLGRVWSRYHGPATFYDEPEGAAASLGAGFEWLSSRSVGVRAEGVLRSDGGGYNATARVLAGWSPAVPDASGTRVETTGGTFVSWMVPLSGPWHFVEPALGGRLSRRDGRVGTSLSLAVFHWQIPGEALLRDYIWDTRAFVATPSIEIEGVGVSQMTARLGPSITMMGEGPGNGVNVGVSLEGAVTPRWASFLTLGVSWLWMPHDNGGDVRVTNADQNGLLVFAGSQW